MNTSITTVQFNGQSLAATSVNGKPFVSIRHICENIGLDFSAQRQRILRNPVLKEGVVVTTTPSVGGDAFE